MFLFNDAWSTCLVFVAIIVLQKSIWLKVGILFLFKIAFGCFFEELESWRVLFHAFFPFRPFKIFAQLEDVREEFVPKVSSDFISDPIRDKVHLRVNVHSKSHLSAFVIDWLVSDNQVFVLKLDMFWIQDTLVLIFFLKVFSVVDRSGVKEQRTIFRKTIIANSLEEGLTRREQRNVVFRIPDPTISRHFFLFFWNLHPRRILFVQIHLNQNGDYGLKRLGDDRLHEDPISLPFLAAADLDSILIRLLYPPLFVDLTLVQ